MTVTIEKMNGQDKQVKEFTSFKNAYSYYAQKCDDLDLDNAEREGEERNLEAGGVGYDYRLTLSIMETTTSISTKVIRKDVNVKFTDDNRNFVKVSGAKNMDQAIEVADAFLDTHGMCVKDGGRYYGDQTEIEEGEVTIFNVG